MADMRIAADADADAAEADAEAETDGHKKAHTEAGHRGRRPIGRSASIVNLVALRWDGLSIPRSGRLSCRS